MMARKVKKREEGRGRVQELKAFAEEGREKPCIVALVRRTVDTRISAMPGRSTSGFHRPEAGTSCIKREAPSGLGEEGGIKRRCRGECAAGRTTRVRCIRGGGVYAGK